MDDILFRHTAIATPNDKSDEFVSRVASSESAKKLVEDSKEFDQLLMDSLAIDVPTDLVDKIMLEQSFAIEQDKVGISPWYIAVAASIAFIIGLSVPMLNGLIQPQPSIGNVAMQHVQQEYFFTAKVNEQASISNVNTKLARYGGTAKEGLGKVLFVNYCSFEGTSALHMILEGEKGQVTVFVVPEDAGFQPSAEFNNSHLKGISEQIGKSNVVIVGERDEPLEKMKAKLDENIKWDI
ncbi:DUF3379 domain-containing protein [Psychromonas sp.]|nr:DUF3379 domain-containing protein [Psychromonas sp.]